MNKYPRCLFNSDIATFLNKEKESIFGVLCDNYHGDLKPLAWSTICKERKELKERSHLTDQDLIDSFERHLDKLTVEELPIFGEMR